MRTILLVSLMTAALAFSSPTRPRHDTAFTDAPAEDVTLMALDKQGVLTVNDDAGKLLGTVQPDGALKLAPHTSQKAFLLGLVNDLRESIPQNDSSAEQLDECKAVLAHIIQEMQTPEPVTNRNPDSRI